MSTLPSGDQLKKDQIKAKLRLYKPHPDQLRFHNSCKRFRVVSFGRQAGKSTACNQELIKKAWENPNTSYWFVSPTYDQAKIQYRRTVAMLWGCADVMLKKNQTELRIKLINNSQVRYVSGEVLDHLRGDTLNGVVVDEVRDQHPQLWPMVLRPMLSTTKGWAAFVSTPNGFDAFYDLYETARADRSGLWECFHAPSTANPLFTIEELELAKSSMSDAQFRQEIMAEFLDITVGKAYKNYTQANLLENSPFVPRGILSPSLPIVLALDFNLSPMAWTIGQERAGEFYWFDEVWMKGTNTQEASLELCHRLKNNYSDALKYPVKIIGDSTGNASQRAAAGQSDYDIIFKTLKDFNIQYVNLTPAANPHIKDRVNAVNAKLKTADGHIKMWLHPDNCKNLKKDLERVVWKEGAQVILDQKTNSDLTHSSDGIGYAVCALSPIPSVNEVGKLRVLWR